jgi:hypothetical protein
MSKPQVPKPQYVVELETKVARLRNMLGRLVFAARYTNIAPEAIKEAEAELERSK